MDTHPPCSGDLNDLERRLAEWRPAATGLDAASMLFAAGRDSVKPIRGRVAWPIISGCLAVLSAALGVGLMQQRTARLELAALIHTPAIVPAPSSVLETAEIPSAKPPAADSYYAVRLAMARNIDDWPTLAKVEPSDGSPPPNPPILKAHSRGELLDP